MTKNFTAAEFACKHCGKHGIKQSFVESLQTLRDRVGAPIVITSGYRCADHPAERNKPKWSIKRHQEGIAADVYCPTMDLEDLYRIAIEISDFTGIGVNRHAGFLHLDARDKMQAAFWQYDSNGATRPWDGQWSTLTKETHAV